MPLSVLEQVKLYTYGNADQIITDLTKYPSDFDALIKRAAVNTLGDIPREALWAFASYLTDSGEGVDIPTAKDFNIPLGALWDNGRNSGHALVGWYGERRDYERYGQPRWYIDPVNSKIRCRPFGGEIAVYSVNLSEFDGTLSVEQQAIRDMIVSMATISVVLTQLALDVENSRFVLENLPSPPVEVMIPAAPTTGSLPSAPSRPALPTKPTAIATPNYTDINLGTIIGERESYSDSSLPDAFDFEDTLRSLTHTDNLPAFNFTENPPSFGNLSERIPSFSHTGTIPAFGSPLGLPSDFSNTVSLTDLQATQCAPANTDIQIGDEDHSIPDEYFCGPLWPTDIDSQMAEGDDGLTKRIDEDDMEMANVELQRLSRLIQKAQISLSQCGTIPDNLRIRIESRAQRLAECGPPVARYQAYTQRLTVQLQSLLQEHQTKLNTFNADLQGKAAIAGHNIASYRTLLDGAQARHTAALSEVQGEIAQNQAAFRGDMERYQARLQREVTDTNVNLDVFRTSLVRAQALFQADVEEYRTKLEEERQRFTADAQRYSLDIQQKLEKLKVFQSYLISKNEREQSVIVQNATLKLQKETSEYEARLQAYLAELQTYEAEVRRWVSEYSNDVQAYSIEYSMLIRKFEADIRAYQTKIGLEIQNLQANITKYQTEVNIAISKVTTDIQAKTFRARQLYFVAQRQITEYHKSRQSLIVLTMPQRPKMQYYSPHFDA